MWFVQSWQSLFTFYVEMTTPSEINALSTHPKYEAWSERECELFMEAVTDDDDGWKIIRKMMRQEFRRGYRAGKRAALSPQNDEPMK